MSSSVVVPPSGRLRDRDGDAEPATVLPTVRRTAPPVPRMAAVPVVAALHLVVFWSYREQVSVVYGYEGYVFEPAQFVWMAAGLALSLLPICWLPRAPRTASQIILWLLYLFVVVPTCAI